MRVNREKIKNYFFKMYPYIVILFFTVLALIPYMSINVYTGHDIAYHFSAINALDEAYHSGSFFSRIYELTCQDYGYGTGLFYSMIPSMIAVIIKNILGISAIHSVFIELIMVLFLAGVMMYKLLITVLKKQKISLLLSIFYIFFPYILGNIYIRFAFSEIFISIVIPMVGIALYELVENQNYKRFILFFVIGFSLGIMIHLTLTIYITIFSLIYLLLNVKKFLNKRSFIILVISSCFVLLISACYYIPMFVGYGDLDKTALTKSAFDIWRSTFSNFNTAPTNTFLYLTSLVVYIIYLIYLITFIVKRKTNSKNERVVFIISTILAFINTPFCVFWLAIGKTFLGNIQFVWRINLFLAVAMLFQIVYLFSRFNKKIFKGIISFFVICVSCITLIVYYNKDVYFYYYISGEFNNRINMLSTNHGIGSGKVGDYFPEGATVDYVFNRANDAMILDTNSTILEFANYQSTSQISFILKPSEVENPYVVLNIPYEECDGLKIYQYACVYNDYQSLNLYELEFSYEEINGEKYLKIEFVGTDLELKITLDYLECETLRQYLIENPFEFIIVSGDENSTITNFVKENSHTYTVSIEVSSTTTIELPTLYYKGYVAKLITDSGEQTLNITKSENGFLQVEISESGVLSIEFEGTYVTVSNVITGVGIVSFVVFYLIYCNFDKIKNFYNKKHLTYGNQKEDNTVS